MDKISESHESQIFPLKQPNFSTKKPRCCFTSSFVCGKKEHLFDKKMYSYVSVHQGSILYYRVIALISANIVPSLDIEGCELASVRRYPNEGQYSPISVR